MRAILLYLCCWTFPPSDPPPDVAPLQVDVIEINHYFDDRGQKVFDQIIFYDWSPDQLRFNVRGYRLVKQPHQFPIATANGRYDSIWIDGERMRHVSAATMRETWTQYDPELAERNYWPKTQRPDLPADVPLTRKAPTAPQR